MNKDIEHQMLFQDFIRPEKKEWIEKAKADLKGADFNRRLVWKNLNGIELQPFYTREDQKELLSNTGHNAKNVINYRRIAVSDAVESNRLALKAIHEGINGILFEINSQVAPESLLKNIDVSAIVVSFILGKDQRGFSVQYKSYLEGLDVSKEKIKGYLDLNFIPDYLTEGKLEATIFDDLKKVALLFEAYPNFKTLMISGTIYQDSGSNQVQEIAFTLNSLVFLIDELTLRELEPQFIFDRLVFTLGISSSYFVEISKFRAFNSLLFEIAKKYLVTLQPIDLIAKTSVWSKSITDANTNLLRATTEAMSALLGNASALEIDPYDHQFKEPNDFSSRISGNIATILREEAYFGKVSNPVKGSFYIEELSLQLAREALKLFKNIEAKGGFFKHIENEIIQSGIAEVRLKKIKQLTQRKQAMVGVNKYPNLMEKVSTDLLGHKMAAQSSKSLLPRRAGLELEQIRLNTDRFVKAKGYRPIVEIASFGNPATAKARAAFSYDFMGVTAYDIRDEKNYDSAKRAAATTASSKSDIVVICSSDNDYREHALDFVKTFKSLNTDKILLLAGYPESIVEELKEAGLDGFIHMRSDILVTLLEIQSKITKTSKPL